MSRNPYIALVAALFLPAQGLAAPIDLPETHRFFSACAGQITAHLSVNGTGGRSGVSNDLLYAIDDIRLSLTTDGNGADMSAEQSAARQAHVALLSRAMARGDLQALHEARRTVERCRDAVLVPVTES